jgi:hypothetical protein
MTFNFLKGISTKGVWGRSGFSLFLTKVTPPKVVKFFFDLSKKLPPVIIPKTQPSAWVSAPTDFFWSDMTPKNMPKNGHFSRGGSNVVSFSPFNDPGSVPPSLSLSPMEQNRAPVVGLAMTANSVEGSFRDKGSVTCFFHFSGFWPKFPFSGPRLAGPKKLFSLQIAKNLQETPNSSDLGRFGCFWVGLVVAAGHPKNGIFGPISGIAALGNPEEKAKNLNIDPFSKRFSKMDSRAMYCNCDVSRNSRSD